MMDWLNANAAAIQAISAVTTAILTVALVTVTRQYVMLVKAQLEDARKLVAGTRREALHELAAHCQQLEGTLARLLDRGVEPGKLRDFPVWDSSVIQRIQVLSPLLSPLAATLAAAAARYEGEARALAVQLKRTTPGTTPPYGTAELSANLRTAVENLKRLEDMARQESSFIGP